MPYAIINKTCIICSQPFRTRHPDTVTCSRICSAAYRTKDVTRHTIKCAYCGNEFQVTEHGGGKIRKFCNMTCLRAASKPTHKTCEWCGVVSSPIKWDKKWKRWVPNRTARTCSKACHKARFTGENSPMWQGGITAYHRSRNWWEIAEKARIRDKHTCQRCGKKQTENGRKLDVHHIITYHTVNDAKKANRLSNLVTLCRTCHRKVESAAKNHRQVVLPFALFDQEKRHATGRTRSQAA